MSDDQLAHFARGALPDRAIELHLERCRRCRGELALRRCIREAGSRLSPAGPCPPPERLLLLEEPARLGADQRDALERHATHCLACALALADAAEARRALPDARAPSRLVAGARVLRLHLRELVRLPMPAPLALNPRGAAGSGSDRLAQGMRAYAGGRYAEAARHLRAAAESGAKTRGLHFLLGVCELQTRSVERAVAALRQAAREGGPGSGERRFFLAQALLLAGDGRGAVAELRRAGSRPGRLRNEARSQERALRGILGRP